MRSQIAGKRTVKEQPVWEKQTEEYKIIEIREKDRIIHHVD